MTGSGFTQERLSGQELTKVNGERYEVKGGEIRCAPAKGLALKANCCGR